MSKKRKMSMAFEFLVACTTGIIDNTLQIYPCDNRLLQLAEMYKMHMEMQCKFFAKDLMDCENACTLLAEYFTCDDETYWENYGVLEVQNAEEIYKQCLPPDPTIDIWSSRFWHLNQLQVPFEGISGEKEEEIYRRLLSQPRLPDIVYKATNCLKTIANKYDRTIIDERVLTISHLLIHCYQDD